MKRIAATLLSTICLTSLLAQNPVISGQFSADPTARVFGGRVYLFPSHDIPPVEGQRQDWFCMADYHVFSSDNLVDWVDHGVILSQENVPWGKPDGYSMWAPDCVQGKDGRYYFYFPDAPASGRGFGVGVAIADRPMGPYKPEPSNIQGIMGIDPCVLQASDGHNYIFWGGGGLRMAKLSDNLLELDPSEIENAQEGPNGMKFYGHSVDGLPEGFKEGPFAFERDGKYYLTYPWVRGKKGEKAPNGEIWENPTECLAYAMSDSPMGPYEYKGVIMEESPTGCWTNHHSIMEFKGQWYLFYHHNDYSPKFDKNRSVRIDSLFFNPDGTIQPVIPTLRGVGITDSRSRVQMDRGTLGGGASIAFNDTLNTFRGWHVVLPAGGWVQYDKVQLPTGVCKEWVNLYDGSMAGVVKGLDQTSLKLTRQDLGNGIVNLRLTNNGKKEVKVDWMSISEQKPLELSDYFEPVTDKSAAARPDEQGFIRRWNLLDPIEKPNPSNTVFVDSYLRQAFSADYSQEMKDLEWHKLDSKRWNVKLFRFASCREQRIYGVLFWGETVIECADEIKDVRLAAGSNSASMWWLNGEEALILSGDRRMVQDDGVSRRLTLKKGRNVLRCAVINGPGMSDFCVRFLDKDGKPVTNFVVK